MGNKNEKPQAGKPTTNANDTSEDTLSGLVADAKRNIKKINKGIEALSALGNSTEITAAKTALQAQKEKVAGAVAKRVLETLLKAE